MQRAGQGFVGPDLGMLSGSELLVCLGGSLTSRHALLCPWPSGKGSGPQPTVPSLPTESPDDDDLPDQNPTESDGASTTDEEGSSVTETTPAQHPGDACKVGRFDAIGEIKKELYLFKNG